MQHPLLQCWAAQRGGSDQIKVAYYDIVVQCCMYSEWVRLMFCSMFTDRLAHSPTSGCLSLQQHFLRQTFHPTFVKINNNVHCHVKAQKRRIPINTSNPMSRHGLSQLFPLIRINWQALHHTCNEAVQKFCELNFKCLDTFNFFINFFLFFYHPPKWTRFWRLLHMRGGWFFWWCTLPALLFMTSFHTLCTA